MTIETGSHFSWSDLSRSDAFWQAYEPIARLRRIPRELLLEHDSRGLLGRYTAALGMLQPKPAQVFQVVEIKRRCQAFEIDQLYKLADLIADLDPQNLDPLGIYDIQGEKIKASLARSKSYLPLILSETSFLDLPNPRDWRRISQSSIDLKSLLDEHEVTTTFQEPDQKNFLVKGPVFIVLLNLLKNAQQRNDNWEAGTKKKAPLEMEFTHDTLTITNHSLTALPKDVDIFLPQSKGKDGNSGHGLAIAKLFATLAGYDLTGSDEVDPAGHYKVTFKLTPKSQTTLEVR